MSSQGPQGGLDKRQLSAKMYAKGWVGMRLDRWLMPSRLRAHDRMIRQLSEMIVELSNDVAALRLQVASVRGKQAVSVREKARNKPLDNELRLLQEEYGGRVIATREPGSKQASFLDEAEEQNE